MTSIYPFGSSKPPLIAASAAHRSSTFPAARYAAASARLQDLSLNITGCILGNLWLPLLKGSYRHRPVPMLRYEGKKLPTVTYAALAGGLVVLATLPLSHLFSPKFLILSVIISLLIAALMGVSSSIPETASFFAAFLLSLTTITLFSANAYPLQESTLVAVLPGVFAAFRPKLALAGFGLTVLIFVLFFDRPFIIEIVSIFLISACISVIIGNVTTYLLREAGTLIKDYRALIFRIVAILFLFYLLTTLYFASIYQMVGAQDASAFSSSGNIQPTFLDYFFYAAMVSTHGATNFLAPTSLMARFTTAVHMLVGYGFTTIYLATAVSVIASRPRGNHAP